MDYLGLTARRYFFLQILKPLVESNKILLTIPDKPKSKYQKYITNNK